MQSAICRRRVCAISSLFILVQGAGCVRQKKYDIIRRLCSTFAVIDNEFSLYGVTCGAADTSAENVDIGVHQNVSAKGCSRYSTKFDTEQDLSAMSSRASSGCSTVHDTDVTNLSGIVVHTRKTKRLR